MKKIISIFLLTFILLATAGCSDPSASVVDRQKTVNVGNRLANAQPTPTDIDYSLERYNLIRRAYWVNGQREKARAVPPPLADIPLGYCVLLTESGAVFGSFVVDGKVSSLNSFLTPNAYDDTSNGVVKTIELPDVDGSYGTNDNGIFFFTPNGNYFEWTAHYLYSDVPFEVTAPVLRIKGGV